MSDTKIRIVGSRSRVGVMTFQDTFAAAPRVGDRLTWHADWSDLFVESVSIGRDEVIVSVVLTPTPDERKEMIRLGWTLQ